MEFNKEEQELNKKEIRQNTLNNLKLILNYLGLELEMVEISEGNYQFLEDGIICGEGNFIEEDSVFKLKIISYAGVITSNMVTFPGKEFNRPTLEIENATGKFEVTTQIVDNKFEHIILSRNLYNQKHGFLIGGNTNCLTRFPNYSEDYFRFKKSKNPNSLKLVIDVNIPTLEHKLYIRSTLDSDPITRLDLFDVRNNRYIPISNKIYRQSLEQNTHSEKIRKIIELCYPEFSTRVEEMLSEYDFGNINLVQNALKLVDNKELNKAVDEICFKYHEVKTLTKKNI